MAHRPLHPVVRPMPQLRHALTAVGSEELTDLPNRLERTRDLSTRGTPFSDRAAMSAGAPPAAVKRTGTELGRFRDFLTLIA